MAHCWTDSLGDKHTLPKITTKERRRLKEWGIVDLYAVVIDFEQWESLFDRISSDGEFITNLAYALEHEKAGSDDEQTAFAELMCGEESGCGPLLECSDALRNAVIDFFPDGRRESIRQLLQLTVTQTAIQAMARSRQQVSTLGQSSDSETQKSGLSGCSELLDTMAPI